jgi:hypothetical protein
VNRDFTDLLSALSEAEVRFLIVGAYAVTFHSQPRSTGDLDLWIDPAPENAKRVWLALQRFGAPLKGLAVEDLSTPDVVYQIGMPPRRIDLLTSLTGLTFEQAWAARAPGRFGDLECAYIGLADLRTNKRAVGRPRDLADLESLGE